MYEDSIYQTIQEGGDTDTNACIVGGMVGSLVGIKRIPKSMINKVLDFDCTDFFKRYPSDNFRLRNEDLLNVKKYAMKNIKILIENRPKGKLNIIKWINYKLL